MSVLTILFAIVSGVSLTIGLVHLIIWGGQKRRMVFLLSAGMALSAGAHSLLELSVAKSNSPIAMNELILWGNLLVAAVLLLMTWFVKLYMGAGRTWLALLITALWGAGLVVNFVFPGNLTFSEIHAARPMETFWGEPYFHAAGTTNPFKFLADAASFLILIFVVDASLTAGRRGAPRRALIVGGSITFFIVVAGIYTPLVDAGVVRTPSLISFVFLAIIAAMSYEIARDVLRTRALVESLRAGQEIWQSLLDTVQLLVWTTDSDGRVTYANPFCLEWKGMNLENLTGFTASELLDATEFNRIQEKLQKDFNAGSPLYNNLSLKDSTDCVRDISLSAMSLTDREGLFSGVLYVASDITEVTNAQRDLANTRQQLDRVMRSNLLGEFASSLAHELNQPLAAILANAEVARRYLGHVPPKLEQVREVIDCIVQDDRRAADLIANLRAMINQNEMPRESQDLCEVIGETLQLLDREMRNQYVTLELELNSSPLLVNASRVETQQVILNLMLNAIQALAAVPVNERVIQVSAMQVGREARIDIRDSGPGIPSEKIDGVFEAFHTERTGNIGLGLSICRRIAESHGGSVTGANNENGGAVFSVYLPLQELKGVSN